MRTGTLSLTLLLLLFPTLLPIVGAESASRTITVTFATFNISDLSTEAIEAGTAARAKLLAEIIQRVNPDVLSLNEIVFDVPGVRGTQTRGENVRKFLEGYLKIPQQPALPGLDYSFTFFEQGNTGVPTGKDLDNDGRTDGPGDAYGFGNYEGQYSIALLSRFPILSENIRTFRSFLWKDMPNNLIPSGYYAEDELAIFRLSSKSHWDVPIDIGGVVVHVIMAHPTPPVFDGPEDRNGRRNHDEIRLIADYVSGANYIYDDKGKSGGLPSGLKFVIMGDMNADPLDGDSTEDAVGQLLKNPFIDSSVLPTSEGAVEVANPEHKNPPQYDTADFSDPDPGNLEVDYVLPSKGLKVTEAKVFWPKRNDPLYGTVEATSDHRLTWLTIELDVEANLAPFPSISYSPTSPKTSDEISFTDKSTDKDGEIASYLWEFGDGASSSERNPTHRYQSRGTFQVKLTVLDNEGAKASTQATIKVTGAPPFADFSYMPSAPVEGEGISFQDGSVDPEGALTSWHWDFGDGATSTERNPTHTFGPGTFTVVLTVNDDEGLTATKQIVVTVARRPMLSDPVLLGILVAVFALIAGLAALRLRKKSSPSA